MIISSRSVCDTCNCDRFLPYPTLMGRIHRRSDRAAEGIREVDAVGQRAFHPDGSGRMFRGSQLPDGFLVVHRAAPDLSVVEEEQLVMCQIHAWKSWRWSVRLLIFFVRLVGLLQSTVVGDVFPFGAPSIDFHRDLLQHIIRVLFLDALCLFSNFAIVTLSHHCRIFPRLS